VPADDFTDPAAVHTFSHLSASIVLSRKRASEGLYPAIDPLQSESKMLLPQRRGRAALPDRPGGPAHAGRVRGAQGHHRHARHRGTLAGGPRHRLPRPQLERYLTQPFFTTEQFTGNEGKGTLVDRPARRVVAEGIDGAFGLLPRHIDFVAALAPGLLSFVAEDEEEVVVALDAGVLVKSRDRVTVAARDGVMGGTAEALEETVHRRFRQVDQRERKARSALARMEAAFVSRFMEGREGRG
jgi:F-type H+-transporting ATPase subunit epsilon